jgi:hypothetical protein
VLDINIDQLGQLNNSSDMAAQMALGKTPQQHKQIERRTTALAQILYSSAFKLALQGYSGPIHE